MSDINLLGSSQTFIGVLTTVVILCVVAGSGNFIYVILKDIRKITAETIRSMNYILRTYSVMLKSDLAVQRLSELASNIRSSEVLSMNLKSNADMHSVLIMADIDEFTNKYVNTFFIPFNDKVAEIKNCREQTFGPLFVFAYCLVVFLCDELVSWNKELRAGVVSFLSILTLGSFFFLGGLWIKFLRECREIPSELSIEKHLTFRFRSYFANGLSKIAAYCIFPLAVALFVLWAIDYYLLRVPFTVVSIITIIVLIASYSYLLIFHSGVRKKYGEYSHSFLLTHFISILISAILYTLLLQLPLDIIDAAKIHFSASLWEIKTAIICFIILFGILLPFYIPFISYCYVRDKAIEECENGKKQAAKDCRSITGRLDNTIAELNERIDDELYIYEFNQNINLPENNLWDEYYISGVECEIWALKSLKQ